MRKVLRLVGDAAGISMVLGVGYALRWVMAILRGGREVRASGNLQAADRAMGPGPFRIVMRRYGAQFGVVGPGAFSGIREMYVRDSYLRHGTLRVADGDVVLDLGANMGNFTNLALACGTKVRVVAVEPSEELNRTFWRSVGVNRGHRERVTLLRAFLGGTGSIRAELLSAPQYRDAAVMTEAELLLAGALDRIDFLKCDIEGGEFELLHRDSALLGLTRKLAIEIHAFAGDVDQFIRMLVDAGFGIRSIKRDPDGTATVLATRKR